MSVSFLGAAAARALDAPRSQPEPETRESCCQKYRDIFTFRNRKDEAAVPDLISLFHSTSSVLLRHEVAYALGQMQRLDAIPFLSELLQDGDEHPITRHEAAEALGAIEAPESIQILEQHAADKASEVSETCGLALSQLNYKIAKGVCGCERRPQEALRQEQQPQQQETHAAASGVEPQGTAATGRADGKPDDPARMACEWRPTAAVAPAPPPGDGAAASAYTYVSPAPAAKAAPVATLGAQLLDAGAPLFERYRALFALRDATPKEGERALQPMCDCLCRGEDSALLKHEVAFVLGQLEHPFAEAALCEAVQREAEHGMVRHEAAEALGAIGSPQAIKVLEQYSGHREDILRESCWVALMWLQ